MWQKEKLFFRIHENAIKVTQTETFPPHTALFAACTFFPATVHENFASLFFIFNQSWKLK
jgi:hypothetical protein